MARTEKEAQGEPIQNLSFEQALRELEAIVSRLESGQVDLEESIAIYERGSLLKAWCETKLKDAQARVEKIVVASDGSISTVPESGVSK